MNRYFIRAYQLVDRAITADGIVVSAVERNRRVLVVESKLREGVPESEIDTRPTFRTVQVSVPSTEGRKV